MRKAAVAVAALTGLTLLGSATLPAVAPEASAQNSGFDPRGRPIDAIALDEAVGPDEAAELAADLETSDPGRYRFPLRQSSGKLARVRKEPGSSMWITFVARLPDDPDYTDEITVRTSTPSGSECDSEDFILSEPDTAYTGPVSLGVLVDPSTVDPAERNECVQAEELLVSVVHEPDGADAPLSAELLALEEPPVSGTEGLPEEAKPEDFEPSWDTAPSAGRTNGAGSFEDAPSLRPGRYSDTIEPGGVRLYRVDVHWGQQLAATGKLPPVPADEADRLPDEGMPVSVSILGPDRRMVAGDEDSPSTQSDVLVGTETPPLRYRNRESGSAGAPNSALAGPYYVLVTASALPEAVELSVPYELEVELSGDRRDGPSYRGPAAPSSPEQTTDPDDREASGQPSGTNGGPWPVLGPLLLGAAVAVCLFAAGTRVLRRTPARRPVPPPDE